MINLKGFFSIVEVAMQVDKPRDAEGVWKDLKECILSEAISVCGETKGISSRDVDPGWTPGHVPPNIWRPWDIWD